MSLVYNSFDTIIEVIPSQNDTAVIQLFITVFELLTCKFVLLDIDLIITLNNIAAALLEEIGKCFSDV